MAPPVRDTDADSFTTDRDTITIRFPDCTCAPDTDCQYHTYTTYTTSSPTPTLSPTPSPSPSPSASNPPAGALRLWTFDSGLDADWGWDYAMVETGDPMNRYATFRADPTLLEVSGGTLKLKARRNADGTWDQSYISTRGRYTHQYGIWRASLKIPAGHALWPSFWLLDTTSGNWHEIDTIEAYPEPGNPTWTFCVLAGGSTCRSNTLPADYSSAFHTYEVEWRASGSGDLLISRVDGVEFSRITTSGHLQPQMGLLTMAVGVWFKNTAPDASTPTHPQLEVDWAGVWP